MFLTQSTFASLYAEGFMDQICTGAHESISEQVPVEVGGSQPASPVLSLSRSDYIYSPASSDIVSKNTCTVVSSSDVSLSFEQDLVFIRQGRQNNNSAFKARYQCFFTSNYVWKCGYSQIDSSVIDVNWTYINCCSPFGNRCRIPMASPWPYSNWQPAVLEKIQSILDSNF
jgi:hypothetical protein